MPKARYTLCIENLSSVTRSSDIKKEMGRYGKVEEVERDKKERCALVLFKRSDDAAYAFRKADGTRFDGRDWRVEWATDKDYDFFGWKWSSIEGGRRGDSRSPSRSVSRSPSPDERKTASTGDKQANLDG